MLRKLMCLLERAFWSSSLVCWDVLALMVFYLKTVWLAVLISNAMALFNLEGVRAWLKKCTVIHWRCRCEMCLLWVVCEHSLSRCHVLETIPGWVSGQMKCCGDCWCAFSPCGFWVCYVPEEALLVFWTPRLGWGEPLFLRWWRVTLEGWNTGPIARYFITFDEGFKRLTCFSSDSTLKPFAL